MEVRRVRGDGFCFLSSVVCALRNDYGMSLEIEGLVRFLCNYILDNGDRYVPFYRGNKESLLDDAIAFFEDKRYDRDVVDLLISITADALSVRMKIYQRAGRQVQLVIQECKSSFYKTIHLRYTGNHYDPITRMDGRVQEQEEARNLQSQDIPPPKRRLGTDTPPVGTPDIESDEDFPPLRSRLTKVKLDYLFNPLMQ